MERKTKNKIINLLVIGFIIFSCVFMFYQYHHKKTLTYKTRVICENGSYEYYNISFDNIKFACGKEIGGYNYIMEQPDFYLVLNQSLQNGE